MPHPFLAPAEADAPRHLAAAIARAHLPAALKFLLLALVAALAGRPLLRASILWHPSHQETETGPESAPHPHALRAVRRIRARIGWLLRGRPARGMSLSGTRAAAPCPTRSARAPPRPA
jgi:hypothetical protein